MMIFKLTRFAASVLSRILFFYQVTGKENVFKVKGAILAVNHSSFLDPAIAAVACPRPVYFLARDTLFQYKYFGALIRKCQAIPFNRDGTDVRTLRNIIKLLQKGKMVIIFPEGTRSPDGKLLPGREGISLVAFKAGVPVVPMYIDGAFRAFPRHRSFIRPAKIRVSIGEPVFMDKWLKKPCLEKQDYQEATALIMSKIAALAKRK